MKRMEEHMSSSARWQVACREVRAHLSDKRWMRSSLEGGHPQYRTLTRSLSLIEMALARYQALYSMLNTCMQAQEGSKHRARPRLGTRTLLELELGERSALTMKRRP